MAQGIKRIMPAEFWTDLETIYPTRGGGKKIAEKYGVDGGFVCRMAQSRGFKKDKQGNILYDKYGNPIQKTSVCITSPELAENLRDIYGILPQKSSLDPEFPGWVTSEFLPHFVRGVFDGDGHVYQGVDRHKHIKQVLGYVGSLLFITGLRDRVVERVPVFCPKVQPVGSIYSVGWFGLGDIEKLYFWMYHTPDVVCLPRKRHYLERMLAGESVPEINISDESELEVLV